MSDNTSLDVTTYKPTDYNPFEGDFGDCGDITFSDKMVKDEKNTSVDTVRDLYL